MKKIMAIAIGILLCIALAVPFFAESQGIIPSDGMKVLFEDDFSDTLDTSKWAVREAVSTSDGVMVLGAGGNWVTGGYSATANGSFSNYALDFDFTGDQRDCYYGVGIRAKAGGGSEFQNGGRFGVPSAAEKSTGISFDLFIKPDGSHVGVALNNGGANGDAAQFLVAYPEGFNGSSGHVTVVDAGDTVTLLINSTEIVTLKLGDGTVTAYDAAGTQVYEAAAEFPASGSFCFYQRNDLFKIDNVKVSSLTNRDFSTDLGDNLSYDQILYDDVMKANGTAEVNALKVLVDGSDGSITKLGMYGWYGNRNSKTAQYGYMIDGGEPVFDDSFFFETTPEDQSAIEGVNPNGYRFKVIVDVSKITDGKTHRIDVVAKLQNGQIVTLNRNESGKDREVFVNYKSVAEPKANMDKFMVNGTGENHNSPESGDAITINKGDTIKALGWVYKYGTNVKRVYWQYVEKGGTIKDGPIMDCSDVYRARNDVANVFGYTTEEDHQYFVKSGFGLDDNLIELLGIGNLNAGEYDVRFVAEFEDNTTTVIKKKFTLTVIEPTVKVIVGEEETNVKPDAISQVDLSMDESSLVIGTRTDASDPWVSIPLNNIDTSVYTSFTVKYRLIGESSFASNNVYLRDTTVNPGYSGESGTWHAPDMDSTGERTFVIADEFPTLAGKILTGVRFVACKPGEAFIIDSITFNKEDTPETPGTIEPGEVIDYDDADVYGMSFDVFYWNATNLGGGRSRVDYFATPDAMHVNYYGGVNTGYSGWVAFKQKVVAFGYMVDDELTFSTDFIQANEPSLVSTVDGWWPGSGETVQRFIITVPFEGQSGITTVVAVAILEDGTVVKLNSKANHTQDTEVVFVFDDAEDFLDAHDGSLSTGWWTNPFNKDSKVTISFTADTWFNGFEMFVYSSGVGQPVHATLKDSEGNVVYEKDFTMVDNLLYTFYQKDAKFAPGDYTVEFDGRDMADDASSWFVLGSANAADGKVVSTEGATNENTLAVPLFRLVKTTEFVEYMSRDQVTIDGVDKASFGGNAEVTDIADNLYADFGKQLRIWGWYGNNYALDKYGVKVDGGEIQYFDRYEAEDIVNHFKANLIKDDDVYASRFEIFVDITEGQHTAEVFAIVNGEEHLIWTINYNCMPEEVPQTTEPGTEPPQTGDALLAMFAVIAVLAMGAAVVFARRKAH